MAGAEYKQVAFLFTDLQIKEDTFLEDISMILNTGEVTMKFRFNFCAYLDFELVYYLIFHYIDKYHFEILGSKFVCYG